MNLLSLAGRGVKWLLFGGADSGPGVVSQAVAQVGKVADVAGKVAGEQIEAGARGVEAQQRENASARSFAAPGTHDTPLDVIVDAMNRLPRPVITFYVFGGIVGWWKLPELSSIDPLWTQAGGIILTFWFGGRLIMKDLPAAVLSVLRAVKGR